MDKRKIVVIGTGGTIAGQGASPSDHTGYVAGQIGVAQLLEAVPGLAGLGAALAMEQLAQLDSKDMDAATLARLARRVAEHLDDPEVDAVVVTHGTDTLEETAYLLQAVLAPAKPVVLTCAMRPASALGADGPQNLFDAVCLAATPGVRGVLAVCAGVVHGPMEVQKVHPYRLDAFSSGEAGPLACLEQGRVRQLRPWPEGPGQRELLAALAGPWPAVPIVMSHADAQAWMVPALVAGGARGLVVATTGNGTVHQALEAALWKAASQGVKVWRASRCPLGAIVASGGPEGLPARPGLSPVKARLALVLDLLAAQAG